MVELTKQEVAIPCWRQYTFWGDAITAHFTSLCVETSKSYPFQKHDPALG